MKEQPRINTNGVNVPAIPAAQLFAMFDKQYEAVASDRVYVWPKSQSGAAVHLYYCAPLYALKMGGAIPLYPCDPDGSLWGCQQKAAMI